MKKQTTIVIELLSAAVCAKLALIVVEVRFGYLEKRMAIPRDWEPILISMLAGIVLAGFVTTLVIHRFPWLVLVAIPVLIRVIINLTDLIFRATFEA